jgi:hypothetical protein
MDIKFVAKLLMVKTQAKYLTVVNAVFLPDNHWEAARRACRRY